MIASHHAKYYAHELTCLHATDSVDRLSQSLFDATVDLNPHQIEAALFALRNPLQQGVLLADEVGLGKTIEAGLVLCQYWAERKRRMVIVCPAALRKQWAQELSEKFALPSVVLDAAAIKKSGLSINSYISSMAGKQIIIMSYHFAAKLEEQLVTIPWDLVVIDEAHKLRNAHRPSNRMGQALKSAFNGRRKVLLTATPLQNSLMELYGLSTLLDEHLFGDEKAFRKQFIQGESDNDELKQRLAGFAKRTLRSQVLEYVRYTKRQAITQPFKPTDQEQELYESISSFLQREISFALPKRQRHLTGLILRKLLASSPYAVTGTLQTILERLQNKLNGEELSDEDLAKILIEQDELEDDYLEENNEEDFVAEEIECDVSIIEKQKDLQEEIAEIESFIKQAQSLKTDTKAEALITALGLGFAKMAEHNAPRKAIIFTESKRTQQFLADYLETHGYKDKIVTFSGTNSGVQTNEIYQRWLNDYKGTDRVTGSTQVDKRTALIDEFRNHAEIMIATEAAAEGVNLQFCALLVNYDLPWNPQRVEQRIGRCHRYGQKHDVVVINFLNTRNQADQRVLELLTEKFQLFSGVFGASDEVLGRIESGVDFEKRIAHIYDTCRKPEDIETAFETLQKELEADINDQLQKTQSQLMEHFDEDVHDKLKFQLDSAQARLDKVSRWFWGVTRFALNDNEEANAKANFDEQNYSFALTQSPLTNAPVGRYQLVRGKQNQQRQSDFMAHAYRLNHPLGEWSLEKAKTCHTPNAELVFDYSNHETKLSVVSDMVGQSGWLTLDKLTVSALDTVESLVFSGITDSGKPLDQEACEKLFSVNVQTNSQGKLCKPKEISIAPPKVLADNQQRRIEANLAQFIEDNQRLFNAEREKLERWADDKLLASEEALKDTKSKISQVKRDARKAPTLEEQSQLQQQLRDLERQQRRQRQKIFDVEDEIIEKRDELIDALQERLTQTTEVQHLFSIRWRVV